MTSKRTISATNETATLAQVIRPILFVRMDYDAGVQRYHTGIGPKTAVHPIHGSESYIGIGDFGGLSSEVVESIIGAPQAIRISLTGVKAAFISDALTDDYYRRDIDVLVGLDDATGTLVDDPEYLFSGFMDKVDISLSQDLGQLTMTCESRATNLLRSPDLRFTDEYKQREVTGDLAGEYIYRMQDLALTWGGFGVGINGAMPLDNRPGPGAERRGAPL